MPMARRIVQSRRSGVALPRALFYADFTADDQALANNTVMGRLLGVQSGCIGVGDTAANGTVKIATNAVELENSTIISANGLGVTLGRPLFSPIQLYLIDLIPGGPSPHAVHVLGVDVSNAYDQVVYIPGAKQRHYFLGSGELSASPTLAVMAVAQFTPNGSYQVALLTGGYNYNGHPWVSGSTGEYQYGSALYLRPTALVDWRLVWRNPHFGHDGGGLDGRFFYHRCALDVSTWQGKDRVLTIAAPDDITDWSWHAPQYYDATPTEGDAGDTANGDKLIEFKVDTLPSAGVIDIAVRYQSDNDRWSVTVSSTGAAALVRYVGGMPTTIATTAALVIAGHVLTCSAIGDYIRTMRYQSDGPGTASATQIPTEATWKIVSLGTGGALGYIAAYNRAAVTQAIPAAATYAAALPRNPADDVSTQVVVVTGDSMFDGDGLERCSVHLVLGDTLGTGATIYDHAVGASKASDLAGRAAAIDARLVVGKSNHLVIWAGTNDFYLDGDSVATVKADLTNFITARISAGWAVYNLAMLNRKQLGGAISVAEHDSRRIQLNGEMAAWCAANGATHVDLATDTRFSDSANNEWFDSLVHLKYNGQALVARYLFDLILDD